MSKLLNNFYEKLRKVISPGDEVIEVKAEIPKPSVKTQEKPSSYPPKLIEGEDFYWEGRYMVLTDKYLLKRGYCCESGCRHCPYGFNKKNKS